MGELLLVRLSRLPLFWQYTPFPFVKSSTAGIAMPRIDSKQPTEEVRKAMTGGPVVHRGETIGAPEGCHENTLWNTDGRDYFMWRTIRTQLSLTLGVGLAGGFLFHSCPKRKPRLEWDPPLDQDFRGGTAGIGEKI